MEKSLQQKELESRASVKSKELYKGKIISLRRDTLQFDAHPPHDWYIITHPGAVAAVPVNNDGKLILIQQWRRAIDQIIYELPAGTLDDGEKVLECMQRELREEIGYKADTLISLGGLYPSPGFCTEYIHLFIAQGLSPSTLPKDLHEAIDVIEVELDDALKLIDSGEIQDAKTVSGILRYKRWLKTNA